MGDELVIRQDLRVADLDGQYAGVVNPITGEVASFTNVSELADWKLAIKELRRLISEAEREVDPILIDAMDRDARWTMNRPGGSISAPSPAPSQAGETWDGNALHLALEQLVQDGVISAQALADAVEIKTEYKAKAAGVKALLKLPAVAPYIEACRLEVEPKPRKVNVK